ncbi:Ku protein [Rhizobium halophytocola]|uniref:Non-homologous end joining protein Ku n=1 Tax=Rhizobium halophytocola TaxID=735519 RepID=A0ABS4DU70_9HYPH|nr:Ku protein [Rhizobium halophytocola]MBP1849254.1 DNA end-binding protein Ku [Rhizobium halophytocola]
MPRNTYWKGHLKLSLVTAAVSLSPATTEQGRIRFHILNEETGNRVESRYIDRETHRAVADRNQVKGFAKEEGGDDYLILEDDELDSVALESTRTIDIESFVPAGSIDWIWYDRPHFLKPENKIGTEAFSVIREAMRSKKVVGIARLVLHRREHAVLLEPVGKGIVLWTLRYAETVRDPEAELDAGKKADRKALSTIETLIDRQTGNWTAAMVKDPVQQKIQKLIKSLQSSKPAKKKTAKKAEKTPSNVIDITEALKKSIAADKRAGQKTGQKA